ncbi:MAG: MgtC/SapB family protein [Myxococcota bacterium]
MDWITRLDVELLRNFGIALCIGALVGVERERSHSGEAMAFGGIRTFTLVAMSAAITAWFSERTGSTAVLVVGFAAVAALTLAAYVVRSRREIGGATTEVAALVTWWLGALAVGGAAEVAVALAIVTTGLLAFKDPLHEAVGKLDRDDIAAGLKLLFATFIVLPILPTHPVDPWGALVPSSLWSLVILISGISLVGYVAVRWLGSERGTVLTGALAGLVSSTALTLAFARRSREAPHLVPALAAGILLAWTVMYVRVFAETVVVHPGLAVPVGLPLGALSLVNGVAAALLWRAATPRGEGGAVALKNPFSLTAAVRFGLFYAVILVVVELARRHLDPRWLLAIAALAGTTDVDAITLSMARVARDEAQAPTAVAAIVVATASNTVVKAAMVASLGEPALRRRLAVVTLLLVTVAAGAVLLRVTHR